MIGLEMGETIASAIGVRSSDSSNTYPQSINWHQLETGDGYDVGCAYVFDSLSNFGANASVNTGKELNEQQ